MDGKDLAIICVVTIITIMMLVGYVAINLTAHQSILETAGTTTKPVAAAASHAPEGEHAPDTGHAAEEPAPPDTSVRGH